LDLVGRSENGTGVSDVDMYRMRLAAQAFDVLDRGIEPRCTAREQAYRGAAAGEGPRTRSTDARAGAGNNNVCHTNRLPAQLPLCTFGRQLSRRVVPLKGANREATALLDGVSERTPVARAHAFAHRDVLARGGART